MIPCCLSCTGEEVTVASATAQTVHGSLRPLLHCDDAELRNTAVAVVDQFCSWFFEWLTALHQNHTADINISDDGVRNHSCTILLLGLIFRIMEMTTQAGDGERNVRNWKLSLLLYHRNRKYKYRLESFLFLASVNALLSPRMASQITWNRYVNLSGGSGNNLDGDYVMELQNRIAKDRIKLLGPNHKPDTVDKIGKTVKVLNDLEKHLCAQTLTAPIARNRTYCSDQPDFLIVLQELCQHDIFKADNRQSKFGDSSGNLFADFNMSTFVTFIRDNIDKYSSGAIIH